ncbi:MAG: DUF975 family protein [Treponema sp.]|nr:DUF975 family protein [Treponema sp.]MBR5032079.1 DUF975 family protein [Treponema sp.]
MYFDREKYKQFARQQIAGRRKTATLAVLIVVVISLLFSIPESRLNYSWDELKMAASTSFSDLLNYINNSGKSNPLTFVFSLIQTIISFITGIAIASFFLTYSRSPEPVSLKVFFEGFNKWGRGILAGLWQTLWFVIWMLAVLAAGLLLMIPLLFIIPGADSTVNLLSSILVIACFVVIIIKAIEYSHHIYLVAEFPELGIIKALKISIRITKGHRAEIFAVHLTFIGYYVLSFLTLGLAQIWFKPYTEMTFINIYHALLKDALENGKINPEDLN